MSTTVTGATSGVADSRQMTEEQRDVLEKVEKLLRLAGKTTHPEEAASAARKAQDLLLAYNLSAAALGSADEGRRGQEKLSGGFYTYERDLMSRIAEVNFCLHWVSRDWIDRPENEQQHAKVQQIKSSWNRQHIRRHQHHLVGRRLSILATEQMYRYIIQATERLTREFVAPGSTSGTEVQVVGLAQSLRSRRAVSFREGVAATVAHKLWERRQDQVAQERAAAEEAEAKAAAAAQGPVSSATALTISSVRQSESDANYDVIYGEGWSARQRADAAARAAARKAADEAYTLWAADNPEEAAAEEKKRRAEEKTRQRRRYSGGAGSRGGRTRDDNMDYGAYEAGRAAGKSVGLEPQAEHSSAPRKIGRR